MKIELSTRADKFLEKMSAKDRARVLRKIYRLPQGDVVAMKSRKGEYRLRIGAWRALFEYRGDIIFIMEIDNRGDIYK